MRCSKSWPNIDRFLTIFDYEIFKNLAKHRDSFFFLRHVFLVMTPVDDSVGMLRSITRDSCAAQASTRRSWGKIGLGSLAALATLTATWMTRTWRLIIWELDRNGGWILYHKLIGIYNIVGISGYGYGSIPIDTIFSGMKHPFTSYFGVHQGYKVLTHCHIWIL